MRISRKDAVALGLIEDRSRKKKRRPKKANHSASAPDVPAVFEIVGNVPVVTMNINLPSLNSWITMQWYDRNRQFKLIKQSVMDAMMVWEAENRTKIERQRFGFPVVFFGRMTRHKDMDNVVIKPVIDAFVGYGVISDDDKFNIPVSPLAVPIEDTRSFIFLFPEARSWIRLAQKYTSILERRSVKTVDEIYNEAVKIAEKKI